MTGALLLHLPPSRALPESLHLLEPSGVMELLRPLLRSLNCPSPTFIKRFNYAELNCAIKRIANILNDRPVSAQRSSSHSTDTDFLIPLTPNMLLTGRNGSLPPNNYDDLDDPRLRKSYIEELEGAWWNQFKVQCFDSLLPTRKWFDTKRNISVDDIVLIKYSSKSFPGTYRLGRVKKVDVDSDNLVRTCTVRYHLVKQITALNSDTVKDVTHKEVCVPIQRLVLILPVEEQ